MFFVIFANPAYDVYISQLVRYARICTSKLDFIHRLRRLSTRLLEQGFKSTLLGKSLAKFFKRHDATIEKYGITLREMRLTIQDWEPRRILCYFISFISSYRPVIWLLYSTWCIMRARNFSLVLRELCLFSWRVCLVLYLTYLRWLPRVLTKIVLIEHELENET